MLEPIRGVHIPSSKSFSTYASKIGAWLKIKKYVVHADLPPSRSQMPALVARIFAWPYCTVPAFMQRIPKLHAIMYACFKTQYAIISSSCC
jgi:hypothetical protein